MLLVKNNKLHTMHKQIKSLKNLGGIWKGRKSEVGKVREAVDADPKSP